MRAFLAAVCVVPALQLGITTPADAETPGQTPLAVAPVPAIPAPATGGFDAARSTPVDSLTSASSRTYHNADGTHTLVVATGDVRAAGDDGVWRDFDLTAAPASGGGWHAAFAPQSATIEPPLGNSIRVDVPSPSGTFIVSHASAGNVPGTAAPGSVNFLGALAGRTLKVAFQSHGFEESVVVPTPLSQLSYRDDITMPAGITATMTNGQLEFVTASGLVIATFGDAAAFDAGGRKGPVSMTLASQTGRVATVQVSVDRAWSTSADRLWPVTIDPTFSTHSSAGTGSGQGSYDTWVLSAIPALSRWSEHSLEAGNDTGANGVTRAMLRFDTSSIPASALVASSQLQLVTLIPACASCPGQAFSYDAVGLGGHFNATTTWSNQPGLDSYGVVDTEIHTSGSTYTPQFNLSAITQRWVNGTEPNYGVELRGHSESVTSSKWEYVSGDNVDVGTVAPTLSITYDVPPAPAQPLSPSTGSTLATSSPRLTVQASADADGDVLQYYFVATDGPDVGHYYNYQMASGWLLEPVWQMPADAVPEGTTMHWTAYVSDGTSLVSSAFDWTFVNNGPPAAIPESAPALGSIAPFLDAIAADLGARYGGAWADDDAHPTLHIGVVGYDAGDVARVSAALQANPVNYYERYVIDPVIYSYATLSSLYDQIAATFAAEVDPNLYPTLSVSLMPTLNKVEVEAGNSVTIDIARELVSGLIETVGLNAVTFVESPTSAGQAASGRWNYPPYYGGLRIKDRSYAAPDYCSSGFVMRSSYTGPNWVGLTAGHCTTNNTWIDGGPNYNATVGVSTFNNFRPYDTGATNADSVFIGLTSQADATNILYVNSTLNRAVTSSLSDHDFFIGAKVCKTAARTGVTCGRVTREKTSEVISYTDPNGHPREKWNMNIVGSDMDCGRGDSGGPVYRPTSNSVPYKAAAAGIVSMITEYHDYYTNAATEKVCWFTTIRTIERYSDAVLRTS